MVNMAQVHDHGGDEDDDHGQNTNDAASTTTTSTTATTTLTDNQSRPTRTALLSRTSESTANSFAGTHSSAHVWLPLGDERLLRALSSHGCVRHHEEEESAFHFDAQAAMMSVQMPRTSIVDVLLRCKRTGRAQECVTFIVDHMHVGVFNQRRFDAM